MGGGERGIVDGEGCGDQNELCEKGKKMQENGEWLIKSDEVG